MLAPAKKSRRDQNGFALIEAIVSLGILGFVAVVFLSGLTIEARGTRIATEQATAESLARSELEYVKDIIPYVQFPGTYAVDPLLDIPVSYEVPRPIIQQVPGADADVQQVTVIVKRNGKEILSLTEYKVNR